MYWWALSVYWELHFKRKNIDLWHLTFLSYLTFHIVLLLRMYRLQTNHVYMACGSMYSVYTVYKDSILVLFALNASFLRLAALNGWHTHQLSGLHTAVNEFRFNFLPFAHARKETCEPSTKISNYLIIFNLFSYDWRIVGCRCHPFSIKKNY